MLRVAAPFAWSALCDSFSFVLSESPHPPSPAGPHAQGMPHKLLATSVLSQTRASGFSAPASQSACHPVRDSASSPTTPSVSRCPTLPLMPFPGLVSTPKLSSLKQPSTGLRYPSRRECLFHKHKDASSNPHLCKNKAWLCMLVVSAASFQFGGRLGLKNNRGR